MIPPSTPYLPIVSVSVFLQIGRFGAQVPRAVPRCAQIFRAPDSDIIVGIAQLNFVEAKKHTLPLDPPKKIMEKWKGLSFMPLSIWV